MNTPLKREKDMTKSNLEKHAWAELSGDDSEWVDVGEGLFQKSANKFSRAQIFAKG